MAIRKNDQTLKENKELTEAKSILEQRMTKMKEELDQATLKLKTGHANYEELETSRKKEASDFKEEIRVTGMQRDGLMAAYKRQMLLLSNLKNQNVCMQHAKLMDFVEKDFAKILSWNKDKQ